MALQKNTFLLTLSNGFSLFTALILSLGLARVWPDQEIYGKYYQLFILVNLVLSLSSGIPLSLSFFYGKNAGVTMSQALYKRFFVTSVLVAFIFSILAFLSKSFWSIEFNNNYFDNYILWIVGIIGMRIVNSFFMNFNLLIKKLWYHLFVSVLYFLLTILLIIICYLNKYLVETVLIGLLIIEAIRFFFFAVNLLVPFKLIKYNNALILRKEEWLYIIPLTGVALLNTLNVYTDKVMISSMLINVDYAKYQVGTFTIPFIYIITGSIGTALIPILSIKYFSNDIKTIISMWKKATEKSTFLLLPILVFSIVFGRYIISFLYGEIYESSGKLFQLYTIRFLGEVFFINTIMVVLGLKRWIVINAITNFGINIVLNIIFIQKLGVVGAVLATVISSYLGYLLPLYIVNKKLKTSFMKYFPLKKYVQIMILSILISTILYVFTVHFNLNKVYVILLSIPYYLIVLIIINKYISNEIDIRKFILKINRKMNYKNY